MTEPLIAQRYVSAPTFRWITDPVTADNREQVLAWVHMWGGRGALAPEGADEALVLYTSGGEYPVLYGDRVVYNEAMGGDFNPITRSVFEARWRPLTDDASA